MEDPLWSIFGPNAPIFSSDIHSVSGSGATSGFLLSPLSDSPETPSDNNENLFPFDPVVSQSLIPGWVHESIADVLPEKLMDMGPVSDASFYGTALDHQLLMQQQQQQQQIVAAHKYQQNNLNSADISVVSKPIQQSSVRQQQQQQQHNPISNSTSQSQLQQRQMHMPLQLDQYQIASASALGIVTPDGTIGPELLSSAQFGSLAPSDMSTLALSPSLSGGPAVAPISVPAREPVSPSESAEDMSDEEKRTGGKRKQSESRMPLPELYARMGLAHNHEEARKREQRILKVLQDQGFELAHKTWVRDTKEHERTKIISEIYNQTYQDYGYDKELIEIIVRRGSYYLMQGRLRRIRRNSRRMELKRQKGLI